MATKWPLPRWLGWIALILGIALFIPYAEVSFFALVVTLLWIIVASVMLYRGSSSADRALGTVSG
jgi:hypothetical protein